MKVTEALIVQRLRDHCLHITRSRIEILSLIYSLNRAVSTGVLTKASGYVFDRITVYRTLHSFHEKGILKLVPNTNGNVEFLLCDEMAGQPVACKDAIFICDECHHHVALPLGDSLPLPGLLLVGSLREVVFKGVCTSCKNETSG